MTPWFHSVLASAALKALPVPQLSNHRTLAGVTPYRLTVPEGISEGLVWRNTPRYFVDASAAEAPTEGVISVAARSRPTLAVRIKPDLKWLTDRMVRAKHGTEN